MSRLLLVDDNPSIHKIAETLLVRTDIELVCSESATQALDLIHRGEHFDVALLDTAMAGMDGWALLDELRAIPSTAGIPIAMMAGVLDNVDPTKIQSVSIQGFLKKPVELRDLADRVHKLLETPVEPPAPSRPKISPFETMPATRLQDLPELRHLSPDTPSVAAPIAETPASAPVVELAPELSMDVLDDLLILTEDDLLPEEEPVAAPIPTAIPAPIPAPIIEETHSPEILDEITEETLDLEELDLDSLRELPPPEVQVGSLPTPVALQPLAEQVPDFTPPEGFLASALPQEPAPVVAEPAREEVELPDLGPLDESPLDENSLDLGFHPEAESEVPAVSFEPEPVAAVIPEPPPMDDFTFDMTEESDSLLASLEPVAEAGAPGTSTEILPIESEEPVVAESVDEGLEYLEETLSGIGTEMSIKDTGRSPIVATPEEATSPGAPVADSTAELLALAEEEPFEVSGLSEVSSPSVPAAPVAPPAAGAFVPQLPAEATPSQRELLAALLADPVLMDALAKAVVARLGDNALREIAWEVMPELAERLQKR